MEVEAGCKRRPNRAVRIPISVGGNKGEVNNSHRWKKVPNQFVQLMRISGDFAKPKTSRFTFFVADIVNSHGNSAQYSHVFP